jgi:hypothetical protein
VTAEIEDLRLSTVMNLVSFVFTISSFSFLNILAEWGGRSLNSAGVSSEARTSRLPHPKQESTLRPIALPDYNCGWTALDRIPSTPTCERSVAQLRFRSPSKFLANFWQTV